MANNISEGNYIYSCEIIDKNGRGNIIVKLSGAVAFKKLSNFDDLKTSILECTDIEKNFYQHTQIYITYFYKLA